MEISSIATLAARVRENVSKVIVGSEGVIDQVLVAMLCSGHILLEDIPGTGKTTLVKTLAKSIDCTTKRIQFTPDLLPSDLTGINFYNQKQQEFVFRPGPVFANIVLADEINRATPRTQSSLLECMEERQITVDTVTYPLEQPFYVFATQNPIETQGTFPLPEAQLDRFFMRLSMGYPNKQNEVAILERFTVANPLAEITAVASKQDLIDAAEAVKTVKLNEALYGYIVDVCAATRSHEQIRLGVSPRGTLALMRASQARAAMDSRSYVIPDDVKAVAVSVLAHRMILRGSGLSRTVTGAGVIEQILEQVKAPTE